MSADPALGWGVLPTRHILPTLKLSLTYLSYKLTYSVVYHLYSSKLINIVRVTQCHVSASGDSFPREWRHLFVQFVLSVGHRVALNRLTLSKIRLSNVTR